MKYLLLPLLLISFAATAQEENTNVTHYVLDNFQDGTVLLKSGEKQYYQLNYNTLTHEMIFDKSGTRLAIAHPDDVDTVFIGERKFVFTEKVFYEVLTNTPVSLFAEYKGIIESQGNSIGYGMGSNLTGNSAIGAVKHSGLIYDLKLPHDYNVKKKTEYWLLKDGKYNKANNLKQIASVFNDKEKLVKELAKKNNTDFEKPADIALLVQAVQAAN